MVLARSGRFSVASMVSRRAGQPAAGPRTGRLTGEPNQGSLARRGPYGCRLSTAD